MSLDRGKACDILGVSKGANEADIRAAYKRLALKWHPDKHANNDAATEKFQEISAAYKYLTEPDKHEFVLTMDDMFELFAQMFFGSRASYNGYFDSSDDYYDTDSDEDFWESVEKNRRFTRKSTEYSYTANRPTASEASKNAEELMKEEERQKKSREKRKSKKKRQREKKREEKVKKEEEESKELAEKQRQEEFLQKAKEAAERAKREAEFKQKLSQSTNSKNPHMGTTKSTSTSKVNNNSISNSFNSSKSKPKAPSEAKFQYNDAKARMGTTGNRVQVSSDSDTEDDFTEWDQDSAFFAGAAATVKRVVPPVSNSNKSEKVKKKGGAKNSEEAESIDNMDPVVLQSRQTAVKGNEMANHGHYSEAIDLFTQAIELDPRDFRFFGNRSFCYDRLEQYERALKDANQAITLSKEWPKGYFRKGRALAGLKHYAEAESAFEHVLKLDKNCEDAVEELHKVRVCRLMDMGFSRPQSDAAIRQYGSVQAALDALLTNGVEGVVNSFPEDVYISDDEDYITETIERSKLDSCNPLNLRSLWIGNLHSTVSEKQLRDIFGAFGEIDSLRRLPDRFCAFINYKRPDEAATALEKLQGMELGGRFLLIKFPDNPIVEGQPRTTVLKKTNPAKQQAKSAQAAIQQLDASGNKVTGPVNGNECYFWRTTGCVFSDRCKYKHHRESKGADLKPWQKVVYDN